jgi:hypothetical protein
MDGIVEEACTAARGAFAFQELDHALRDFRALQARVPRKSLHGLLQRVPQPNEVGGWIVLVLGFRGVDVHGGREHVPPRRLDQIREVKLAEHH